MIFFGWGRLGGPAALIGGGFAMIVRQFCKKLAGFLLPKGNCLSPARKNCTWDAALHPALRALCLSLFL
jgi:hypothetical protein